MRAQKVTVWPTLLAREYQVRSPRPLLEFGHEVARQGYLPFLMVLGCEPPFRMVTDGVHPVSKINVIPGSVHNFLLPSARTQEELKRKPFLGAGRTEQQPEVVPVVCADNLLGVAVPDGHVLDFVVPQEGDALAQAVRDRPVPETLLLQEDDVVPEVLNIDFPELGLNAAFLDCLRLYE